jgi:TIR domain
MAQRGQIFISYARQDRGEALTLAQALADKGLSVWWDFELVPGQAFREAIASKIDTANTVIVLWSPSSINSGFVLDEAARAARQKKLVPLSILGVEPPLGFGQLHTLPVSSVAEDIDRILAAIEGLPTGPARKTKRKTSRWYFRAAVAVAALVACAAAIYATIDQRNFDSAINCIKYGCALDYVTYRSKPMRLQFVYPMHQLMLDTTQEASRRLPLINAKGETEVEIFRSSLSAPYDVMQESANEQARLKADGWSINYVAPQVKPEEKNWYAISGMMPDGRHYYFRRWHTHNDLVSIEFRYRPESKTLYDKIIADMTLGGLQINDL